MSTFYIVYFTGINCNLLAEIMFMFNLCIIQSYSRDSFFVVWNGLSGILWAWWFSGRVRCLPFGRSQVRIPLWPPRKDLEQLSFSPAMLCITIESASPRHESAHLSLSYTRKNGNRPIKDQLQCIVLYVDESQMVNQG